MRYIFLAFIFIFFSAEILLAGDCHEAIWLVKPEAKESLSHGKGHGQKKEMHQAKTHGKDENIDKGKPKKKRRSPMSKPAVYNLKSGAFPDQAKDSPFLYETVCWLKIPDGSHLKLEPEKKDGHCVVYDEARQAGFYQLYLYNDRGVTDGVRHHLFSTLWFRNSGEDDFEEKAFEEKAREGMSGKDPVFYLKELTVDTGNNFVSQKRYTGDKLPVQILMNGVPVEGAEISLVTKSGWSKKIRSDKAGKAEFVLIKEIFHNKKIHKKPEPYLIKASYEIEKSGVYKGSPYSKEVFVATSPIMVYPTPLDWKSKSSGFYVVAGSTLAVMFAAAIRRKGRRSI